MAESYRLYEFADSPSCAKVRACLNVKNVSYQRVPVTVFRRRELGRLNPLRKVPVLVADGIPIADSSRIVRVVEERFPRPPLLPRQPEARAYCDLLEEWADEALTWIVRAFVWLNPRNRKTAYAACRDWAGRLPVSVAGTLAHLTMARRLRAWGYTRRALPELEARMKSNLASLDELLGENRFLLGKYLTLADIAVYAPLAWMQKYEERRLLDSAPRVRQWMDRLAGVPEIRAAL